MTVLFCCATDVGHYETLTLIYDRLEIGDRDLTGLSSLHFIYWYFNVLELKKLTPWCRIFLDKLKSFSSSINNLLFIETAFVVSVSDRHPLNPVLDHMDPVYNRKLHFFTDHFNTVLPHSLVSQAVSSLGFPTKILNVFLLSPMCATCLAYVILFV